jgi:hypothetical protein
MEIYAITTYVIAEEVLKLLKFHDDPQVIMSNAEVITFAIVTAKFFTGNYKMARLCMPQISTIPKNIEQ